MKNNEPASKIKSTTKFGMFKITLISFKQNSKEVLIFWRHCILILKAIRFPQMERLEIIWRNKFKL